MTIQAGDVVGLVTCGVFETQSVSAAPTVPTFTLVSAAGTVTATIDGDTGVTNYLRFKIPSDIVWQDGGSRSGDGDLVVTGLDEDVNYSFVCYSITDDGAISLPSPVQVVSFTATHDNVYDDILEAGSSVYLDEFSEDIIYLPAGGGSREIRGIVNREMPEDIPGAPHGNTPVLTVSTANDATAGISSSELNTGGDRITIDVRAGKVATNRKVTRLLAEDAGMIKVELR